MKTLRTIAAVALLTVIPHAHAADIPAVGDKVVSSTETLACKTSEDTRRNRTTFSHQCDTSTNTVAAFSIRARTESLKKLRRVRVGPAKVE